MIRGTNSFHEPLHGPDAGTRSKPVDGRGHSECAGQSLDTRRSQAMDRNYSRPGRLLIGGGAPRELGGAVVERTLEDGHCVYRKTSWIMPADISI
jgi:hypothetical protein